MVDRQEIGWVPDSDDEDAKKDLELKRKMNLEKGRRVARENQQKGSRIWHAIKSMPGDRRLHIRDILDIKCASSSSSTSRTTGKCTTNPYDEFNIIKCICNFTTPSEEEETVFTKE